MYASKRREQLREYPDLESRPTGFTFTMFDDSYAVRFSAIASAQ